MYGFVLNSVYGRCYHPRNPKDLKSYRFYA